MIGSGTIGSGDTTFSLTLDNGWNSVWPVESARQPMNQRPLQPLEDLILESLNPRAITGLPHPLSKFAANGTVKEGPYADAILEFVNDLTWETPESARYKAAKWFLFESEQAFFVACSEAGIDAKKLRSHLLRMQVGRA